MLAADVAISEFMAANHDIDLVCRAVHDSLLLANGDLTGDQIIDMGDHIDFAREYPISKPIMTLNSEKIDL